MQLVKFNTDLPIDMIEDVIRLLGIFIAMVKDKSFFLGSDDFLEYNETLEYARRDLNDYHELYENWQSEDNASEFEAQLAKMHDYLIEARAVVSQATHQLH